jgi:chromosome segregation ATPase
MRNEANRLMIQYKDKRGFVVLMLVQIDDCLSRIETLNSHINSAEDEMNRLKKRYEHYVKDRNTAGVHLLDRNDELCILYERINVQQEIMAKGEEAFNQKEDELRRFNIILAELSRKVELEKSKLPILNKLTETINEYEKRKESLESEMNKLGEKMENPDDPKRCRILGGTDPSQEMLSMKIERLESFLITQEVLCY